MLGTVPWDKNVKIGIKFQNVVISDMPSHLESRKKVCAVCWNQKGKGKIQAPISRGSTLEAAVATFVDSNYIASDLHTPCSIISTLKLTKNLKIWNDGSIKAEFMNFSTKQL